MQDEKNSKIISDSTDHNVYFGIGFFLLGRNFKEAMSIFFMPWKYRFKCCKCGKIYKMFHWCGKTKRLVI